jgi:hypothetical protein
LATAYRRALESFGAEAQDFKITDNISSFVEWLHNELKLQPDTMSKIGDYGAATCLKCCCTFLSNKAAIISKLSEYETLNSLPPRMC